MFGATFDACVKDSAAEEAAAIADGQAVMASAQAPSEYDDEDKDRLAELDATARQKWREQHAKRLEDQRRSRLVEQAVISFDNYVPRFIAPAPMVRAGEYNQ